MAKGIVREVSVVEGSYIIATVRKSDGSVKPKRITLDEGDTLLCVNLLVKEQAPLGFARPPEKNETVAK